MARSRIIDKSQYPIENKSNVFGPQYHTIFTEDSRLTLIHFDTFKDGNNGDFNVSCLLCGAEGKISFMDILIKDAMNGFYKYEHTCSKDRETQRFLIRVDSREKKTLKIYAGKKWHIKQLK